MDDKKNQVTPIKPYTAEQEAAENNNPLYATATQEKEVTNNPFYDKATTTTTAASPDDTTTGFYNAGSTEEDLSLRDTNAETDFLNDNDIYAEPRVLVGDEKLPTPPARTTAPAGSTPQEQLYMEPVPATSRAAAPDPLNTTTGNAVTTGGAALGGTTVATSTVPATPNPAGAAPTATAATTPTAATPATATPTTPAAAAATPTATTTPATPATATAATPTATAPTAPTTTTPTPKTPEQEQQEKDAKFLLETIQKSIVIDPDRKGVAKSNLEGIAGIKDENDTAALEKFRSGFYSQKNVELSQKDTAFFAFHSAVAEVFGADKTDVDPKVKIGFLKNLARLFGFLEEENPTPENDFEKLGTNLAELLGLTPEGNPLRSIAQSAVDKFKEFVSDRTEELVNPDAYAERKAKEKEEEEAKKLAAQGKQNGIVQEKGKYPYKPLDEDLKKKVEMAKQGVKGIVAIAAIGTTAVLCPPLAIAGIIAAGIFLLSRKKPEKIQDVAEEEGKEKDEDADLSAAEYFQKITKGEKPEELEEAMTGKDGLKKEKEGEKEVESEAEKENEGEEEEPDVNKPPLNVAGTGPLTSKKITTTTTAAPSGQPASAPTEPEPDATTPAVGAGVAEEAQDLASLVANAAIAQDLQGGVKIAKDHLGVASEILTQANSGQSNSAGVEQALNTGVNTLAGPLSLEAMAADTLGAQQQGSEAKGANNDLDDDKLTNKAAEAETAQASNSAQVAETKNNTTPSLPQSGQQTEDDKKPEVSSKKDDNVAESDQGRLAAENARNEVVIAMEKMKSKREQRSNDVSNTIESLTTEEVKEKKGSNEPKAGEKGHVQSMVEKFGGGSAADQSEASKNDSYQR